jgi:hypothetical protein
MDDAERLVAILPEARARQALATVIRVLTRRKNPLGDHVIRYLCDIAPYPGIVPSDDWVTERGTIFLREATRRGPRRGPRSFAAAEAESLEHTFARVLKRNPHPSRRTWDAVCRRLWRRELKAKEPLPGYVVNEVMAARTPRGRAVALVAAFHDNLDPRALRKAVDRQSET